MGKYIIKALVFLVLFISVYGIIGLQDGELSIPKVEEVEIAELPPEPEPEPTPEIMFSNMEVQPGGCFGIYITGMTDRDQILVSTELVQDETSFFNQPEGKLAFVGISCRTKEGEYKYSVKVQRDGETVASGEETVKILPKDFEKQYLEVTVSQKEQRSDDNFDEDKVHTDRAKSLTMERPLWEGTFLRPVEGRISTGFGMIRYVNKEESGRHSGLDIAAARGTPVKASNDGVVRLSMMLKVTGNTIIIDHGCNIYTSYAHLDKLMVEEGDVVKKGDIIGEVGSTGFSTGPHLHWTTTIGKLYINPEVLMETDPTGFIDTKE